MSNYKVEIIVNGELQVINELSENEITLLLAYVNKLVDIHKGIKNESESDI